MERTTRVCYTGQSASRCLQVMRDADLEFLLVLDRRVELVGLVADHDVDFGDASELEVDKIMSTQLVKCSPEEDIRSVARKMSSAQVGVAVVTENGRLIGVLTAKDLLRGLHSDCHERPTLSANYRMSGIEP